MYYIALTVHTVYVVYIELWGYRPNVLCVYRFLPLPLVVCVWINMHKQSVLEDIFNPIVNVIELSDTSALQVNWFVTTDRASGGMYVRIYVHIRMCMYVYSWSYYILLKAIFDKKCPSTYVQTSQYAYVYTYLLTYVLVILYSMYMYLCVFVYTNICVHSCVACVHVWWDQNVITFDDPLIFRVHLYVHMKPYSVTAC